MLKKSILIRTLIFAFLIISIKYLLGFIPLIPNFLGYENPVQIGALIEISEVTVIFTGTFFIVSLILAGTMADFKESEKLPGEIACNLEAIEDHMILACRVYKSKDGYEKLDDVMLHGHLKHLTKVIIDWFNSSDKDSKLIFNALRKINDTTCQVAKLGADKDAVKGLQDHTNQLRKNLTRAYCISKTDFLGLTNNFLISMIGSSILLILVCKFKTPAASYAITGLISFIFLYLFQLIKGLEDPFDYKKDDINVDIIALNRFNARIEKEFEI